MRAAATQDTKLPYQTALVTGASSGMGKAFAAALAASGLKVYATSRNPDQQDSSSYQWLPFEGASQKGLQTFISQHGECLRKVDILVNNAGSSSYGDLVRMEADDMRRQWQLLFHSPAVLTKEVLGPMRARGRGAIVNVSSLAALFPLPWMSVYSASKAALSQFTQSLQVTEDSQRVRLIDFQPGDYKTAFNEAMCPSIPSGGPEERAWKRMQALLENGPSPTKAAHDLMQALNRRGHRRVRSGTWFQARCAPLGLRLLPTACLRRIIARYYGLTSA